MGAKLRFVVGQEIGRGSSEKNVTVLKDVGGAFCGEFGFGVSEDVRMVAETIREKEDVSVFSSRGR